MELYKSLDSTSSVILAGQPGSGKTKLCHALAKAINLLNYKMVSNDATKEENRSQSQVSNHHSQNIQVQGSGFTCHFPSCVPLCFFFKCFLQLIIQYFNFSHQSLIKMDETCLDFPKLIWFIFFQVQ